MKKKAAGIIMALILCMGLVVPVTAAETRTIELEPGLYVTFSAVVGEIVIPMGHLANFRFFEPAAYPAFPSADAMEASLGLILAEDNTATLSATNEWTRQFMEIYGLLLEEFSIEGPFIPYQYGFVVGEGFREGDRLTFSMTEEMVWFVNDTATGLWSGAFREGAWWDAIWFHGPVTGYVTAIYIRNENIDAAPPDWWVDVLGLPAEWWPDPPAQLEPAPAAEPIPARDSDITVLIDGVPVVFNHPPLERHGFAFFQVDEIFEALADSVHWDAATETVSGALGNNLVEVQIRDLIYIINGAVLDTPPEFAPFVENGLIYVYIDFIIEGLGLSASWDGTTRTFGISN